MTEPVRIVVTIEGGFVNVCTLGIQVEVVIIDYDTEGADREDLVEIDQGGVWPEHATVRFEVPEPLHPAVMTSIEGYWPQ